MSTGVLRDWARGRHPLCRAFLSVLSGSVAVQEVLVGGLGRAKLRDLKMSATDLASGSVKGPVKKPPSRVRPAAPLTPTPSSTHEKSTLPYTSPRSL